MNQIQEKYELNTFLMGAIDRLLCLAIAPFNFSLTSTQDYVQEIGRMVSDAHTVISTPKPVKTQTYYQFSFLPILLYRVQF